METSPAQFTTTAEILDTWLETRDIRIMALIKTRPINEIVSACVDRQKLDLAVVFLDGAYYRTDRGSPEDLALAKAGFDIVDPCVDQKRLDIAEWLINRAADIYPPGTAEHRQVLAKRVEIEEKVIASRKLGTKSLDTGVVTIIVNGPSRAASPPPVAVAG